MRKNLPYLAVSLLTAGWFPVRQYGQKFGRGMGNMFEIVREGVRRTMEQTAFV